MNIYNFAILGFSFLLKLIRFFDTVKYLIYHNSNARFVIYEQWLQVYILVIN